MSLFLRDMPTGDLVQTFYFHYKPNLLISQPVTSL
jgi:hypothetical protein